MNIDELAKKYGIEKPTPPTKEEIEAFDKWFESYKEAEKRGWVGHRPAINTPYDLYDDALQSWKNRVDGAYVEELVSRKAEARRIKAERIKYAKAAAAAAYRKALFEMEGDNE